MSENYRKTVSGEGSQPGPPFWLHENSQGKKERSGAGRLHSHSVLDQGDVPRHHHGRGVSSMQRGSSRAGRGKQSCPSSPAAWASFCLPAAEHSPEEHSGAERPLLAPSPLSHHHLTATGPHSQLQDFVLRGHILWHFTRPELTMHSSKM